MRHLVKRIDMTADVKYLYGNKLTMINLDLEDQRCAEIGLDDPTVSQRYFDEFEDTYYYIFWCEPFGASYGKGFKVLLSDGFDLSDSVLYNEGFKFGYGSMIVDQFQLTKTAATMLLIKSRRGRSSEAKVTVCIEKAGMAIPLDAILVDVRSRNKTTSQTEL